ncbi:MAG: PDZ domain-containing protein [Actinobacteria bacterium]|nr:MAG: PDZ domain-containing protein [Actinomycetota bacterium]TMK96386.1 MAG: PDZ domain-containing protein [Actinomycetota bacterium]
MIPNEDDPYSGSTAPDGVAEPAKPSGSLVSWRKSAFLAPVAILALILYFVRLPYFVLQPGPAEDVEPLIHIQSQQTYPGGHLLLTSVGLYQPNAYQAFWAWVDRAQSVVPERDILAPGETPQEETQQAISQMDTSKIDAAVVALTKYAGYPDRHGRGVLVESVLSGSPASGKLFAGDVVLSVDGRRAADPDQLGRMIRAAGVGHALTFEVKADGQTRRVQVAPGRIQGIDHPAIGIGTVAAFPFPLEIDSGDIGGPSAGLMWTLGLVDLLTPGDLTGGHIVAGTGTIDLTGKVGPIGGISQKVVAAERAGATVFFAPAEEASQARSVAHHIVIVPVRSYTDAVSYLGGPAS